MGVSECVCTRRRVRGGGRVCAVGCDLCVGGGGVSCVCGCGGDVWGGECCVCVCVFGLVTCGGGGSVCVCVCVVVSCVGVGCVCVWGGGGGESRMHGYFICDLCKLCIKSHAHVQH